MARLRMVPPERLIFICSVTLGEIEAGHAMTETTDQDENARNSVESSGPRVTHSMTPFSV